jgi:hypothetical protein
MARGSVAQSISTIPQSPFSFHLEDSRFDAEVSAVEAQIDGTIEFSGSTFKLDFRTWPVVGGATRVAVQDHAVNRPGFSGG